ncbi:MAG: hypothetical protein COS89_06950 [Deltaproteobacteria bacterium CG07_land_8_20_14_0_80_38_7]|nr:MAG: hypothetical protein COS89_06950 [Deltaproteobacteria bacterium CG07_land_8_20_14_0_80_38_7]
MLEKNKISDGLEEVASISSVPVVTLWSISLNGTSNIPSKSVPGETVAGGRSKAYLVAKLPVGRNNTADSKEITVTLTGLDNSATPVSVTGTATLGAGVSSPIGKLSEFVFTPPLGTKKITSVTAVTIDSIKYGAFGDCVEIIVLPETTDFQVCVLKTNFTFSLPMAERAIAVGYDPANHYKRTRAEQTWSMDTKATYYGDITQPLSYVGRDITLKIARDPAGSGVIIEETYLGGRIMAASKTSPETDDVSVSLSGTYSVLGNLLLV